MMKILPKKTTVLLRYGVVCDAASFTVTIRMLGAVLEPFSGVP